ncbi:MAG: hypothetical protein WA896_04470, partial [Spirulinaceae cyanobacterium]
MSKVKRNNPKIFSQFTSKRRNLPALGAATILSLTGLSWLGLEIIAPQVAQAYVARVDVNLNRQPGEAYQTMLARGLAVARAAVQRSFDRDILITEVKVTISGENKGAIAPIMMVEVSRQEWNRQPDARFWVSYMPNAEALLNFETAIDTEDNPGGSAPTPTPRNGNLPIPQGAPPTEGVPQTGETLNSPPTRIPRRPGEPPVPTPGSNTGASEPVSTPTRTSESDVENEDRSPANN